jgi:hypothetical protein
MRPCLSVSALRAVFRRLQGLRSQIQHRYMQVEAMAELLHTMIQTDKTDGTEVLAAVPWI